MSKGKLCDMSHSVGVPYKGRRNVLHSCPFALTSLYLPRIMLIPTSTATIDLVDDTIFLHPADLLLTTLRATTVSPMLSGTFSLKLTRKRRFKWIRLKLVRFYEIFYPEEESARWTHNFESGAHTESEVVLLDEKDGKISLGKGAHDFPFALPVPSTSAPRENCRHGRISHRLIAVAKADGLLRGDLTASRLVSLIANPVSEGETQKTDIIVENYHPELGPYAVTARSQHLTVGGVLEFTFHLACPPRELQIHSVAAYLNVKHTLVSPTFRQKPAQHLDTRVRIFQSQEAAPDSVRALPSTKVGSRTRGVCENQGDSAMTSALNRMAIMFGAMSLASTELYPQIQMDMCRESRCTSSSPLARVPQSGSYNFHHVARLPLEESLSPSTIAESDTPIQVAHELSFEVLFESIVNKDDSDPPPAGHRQLTVKRPITISSCHCHLESLLVPCYSEIDVAPLPPFEKGSRPSWSENCVCRSSIDLLIAQQRSIGLDCQPFDRLYRNPPKPGL
ncbi:uncharacterized protein EI90DRAFT_161422 [Cantharellus anzutake]|uniref:uncharacterized protein n=1 Tax=Cantharellus anzutake TaxID=1750568 RepID=UPI0019047008|nr:uncharacterized protein EI90DRAFT_161422 [Cantharellus anzutake]KAF8336337.1 hypothetical protein EI90DRAFT_161422 [Cantharellus anzutake]